MKHVYICHPYGGDPKNVKKALQWAKRVAALGYAPEVSWCALVGVLDLELGLKIDCAQVKRCDVLLAIVPKSEAVSDGMRREIKSAVSSGVPIAFVFTHTTNEMLSNEIERAAASEERSAETVQERLSRLATVKTVTEERDEAKRLLAEARKARDKAHQELAEERSAHLQKDVWLEMARQERDEARRLLKNVEELWTEAREALDDAHQELAEERAAHLVARKERDDAHRELAEARSQLKIVEDGARKICQNRSAQDLPSSTHR
jgi:hypothetical protein